MPRESYCIPFLNLVGDAYPCWQEDGFYPDRLSIDENHILVWSAVMGISSLYGSSVAAFLGFTTGRMLPEMGRGFSVLQCRRTSGLCQELLGDLGEPFPRADAVRRSVVSSKEADWAETQSQFMDALQEDAYERRAEDYCRWVCEAHQLAPKRYGR